MQPVPGAFDPEVVRLIESVRAGEVHSLARAVSLVENCAPLADQVLSCCFPYTGSAIRIGVTGAPGAGKSTLVDCCSRQYRSRQLTVGVIAVDPSSPYTGGAILGDRIRMQQMHSDPGFYMRSMATRGFLGGLARTTADVADVIEAGGKERILIETVGVGQDEIDVVRLADVNVLVLVPGMGDDVQSIKAGVMEIADIFVINKSDREGADRLEKEIRALQSFAPRHGGWVPPIIRTVATAGAGTQELLQAIDTFWLWLGNGELAARRKAHWRERLLGTVRSRLIREVRERGLCDEELAVAVHQIVRKELDPYVFASRLVGELLSNSKKGESDG